MKPATYDLANLGLVVTISPDARRWVQEHIVSLETYAWQQAQRHIDGKSVDRGVVINDRRFRTVSDKRPSGDAQAGSATLGSPKGEPRPVVDSAPQAGEWPRWRMASHPHISNNAMLLLRFDCPDGEGRYSGATFADKPVYGDSSWVWNNCYMDEHGKELTPTEAAQWLRDNGHESEAAKIEGDVHPKLQDARVFKDSQWFTLCLGERRVAYKYYTLNPSEAGWKVESRMRTAVYVELDRYIELHGPERQEILRDFAASEVGRKWLETN